MLKTRRRKGLGDQIAVSKYLDDEFVVSVSRYIGSAAPHTPVSSRCRPLGMLIYWDEGDSVEIDIVRTGLMEINITEFATFNRVTVEVMRWWKLPRRRVVSDKYLGIPQTRYCISSLFLSCPGPSYTMRRVTVTALVFAVSALANSEAPKATFTVCIPSRIRRRQHS